MDLFSWKTIVLGLTSITCVKVGYPGCYLILEQKRKRNGGLARKSRGCLWYVFASSTVPFQHRWVEEKDGNLQPEYCLSPFNFFLSWWSMQCTDNISFFVASIYLSGPPCILDKYYSVIYTAVIDIHILWIRFCTWIGMTTMEESRHRLILFRSYFCYIIWDCWSLQFYIDSLFVRIQLFIY